MNARRNLRRLTFSPLETLDDRIVPSGLGVGPATVAVQEALVATKGSSDLGAAYQDYVAYQQAGSRGTFHTSESGQTVVRNKAVEVNIQEGGGNFNSVVKGLKASGMQVTSSSAGTGLIAGYLPIADLPSVAGNAHVASISPVPTATAVPSPPPVTASAPGATVTMPSVASALAITPAADPSLVQAVEQKGGPVLGSIYQEFEAYEAAGGTGTFTPSEAGKILFNGTAVGVDLRYSGDDAAFVAEMQALGMNVTATSTASKVVEGFLPIAQLPAVAVNVTDLGLSPIFKPTFF